MVGINIHEVKEVKIRSYREVQDKNNGKYFVLILDITDEKGNETDITLFSQHSYDWKTGEYIEICSLEGLQEYPEIEGDY